MKLYTDFRCSLYSRKYYKNSRKSFKCVDLESRFIY